MKTPKPKPVAVTVLVTAANATLLRELGYLGGISVEALASGMVATLAPTLAPNQNGYRDDGAHMSRLEDGRDISEEVPELARFTPPPKPCVAVKGKEAK